MEIYVVVLTTYSQTLPEMGDVAEAFSGLLEQTSKYGGWDLIGQGSVDVALSLLDFNAPFKPKMCQAVWGCAKKILSSVVALRSEPVREILNQVRSRTPIFRFASFLFGSIALLSSFPRNASGSCWVSFETRCT